MTAAEETRFLLKRYVEKKLLLPPRLWRPLADPVATDPEAMSAPAPSSSADPGGEAMAEVVASYHSCRLCGLCEGRSTIVFGTGGLSASLMLVGEAPGAEEDRTGLPFVGRSGALLTKMLAAINIGRDETFITNVVKCRPPGNRTPMPAEIESCRPLLEKQIAIIKPRLILALGGPAARWLLGLEQNAAISKIRGRAYLYKGIRVIPTFHPAYLLRNPSAKKEVWEDLKLVRKVLDEPE